MVRFALLLAANIAYAVAQWTVMVVIARLADVEAQGQYAYALALTAPLGMLLRCNLSAVLATDQRDRFRGGDYLSARLVTTLLFLFLAPCLAFVLNGTRVLVGVVFCVACFKSIEGLSDIAAGALQRKQRSGRQAVSLVLRAVLLISAFLLVLGSDGNIPVAALLTAGLWFLAFRFVDWPAVMSELSVKIRGNGGCVRRLLTECWPLGVSMALVSLINYMPTYVLQASVGLADVGRFAVVNYLGMIGTLVGTAAIQATSGKLSKSYRENRRSYFRQFGIIITALLAAGLLLVAVIQKIGEQLLLTLYGSQYAGLGNVLSITAVGVVVTIVIAMFGLSLTICRAYRAMLFMNVVTVGIVLMLCLWLIPGRGLVGAAEALLYGLLIKLAISIAINAVLMRRVDVDRC